MKRRLQLGGVIVGGGCDLVTSSRGVLRCSSEKEKPRQRRRDAGTEHITADAALTRRRRVKTVDLTEHLHGESVRVNCGVSVICLCWGKTGELITHTHTHVG